MQDVKLIIAQNISELRRGTGMTQLELAEKLNYTDKAVSKWERGESVPDIQVLMQISSLFGVKVDYLLSETHERESEISGNVRREKIVITLMSMLFVWLAATAVDVMFLILAPQIKARWLAYVYAVPLSIILWLIFNTLWFNRRLNYLIISLLMWTVLASVQISFLIFSVSVLPVFLLGIPGQIIIILWSRLKSRSAK